MGLGFATAGGVAGGYATLDRLLAQRKAEALQQQQYQDKLQQQDIENQQRNRQLDQSEPKATPHNPYVVGKSLVSPEGGVLYSEPQQAATPKPPGVHVIGGNLVDDAGKVIFTAPREPTPPRDVHPIQVQGPDGAPIWVRPEDALGKPAANAPRAPTGSDRTTLNFFNRMLQAEKDARGSENDVGLRDTVLSDMPLIPNSLENMMHSGAGQKYTQAQRAFTEARLRKESGAAINNSEYENDRTMNFRVTGDKPELLKQKRNQRLTTLRGLGNASGRAFQEYYGEGVTLDDLLKEFGDQPQGEVSAQEYDWVNGQLVPRAAR